MAESTARLKILANIEGLEGLEKLRSALKGLQQTASLGDQTISKAREEILAFGKAGAQSEQRIRGQIDALKALQAQSVAGGAAYRELSRDIKSLGAAYQEAATGVKTFTDAQLKSQFVGAKPLTFAPQIAALKRDLQELSVYGSEYSAKLAEIQKRQIPFDTATGRQSVIANAQAYAAGSNKTLPTLPDTTAALSQRIGELTQNLANVTRGGDSYLRIAREISAIEKQLARDFLAEGEAVQAAQKRLEQSRAVNATSGFGAFSASVDANFAIQKSIARNAKKNRPENTIEQPLYEISQLYGSINDVGMSRVQAQINMMGKSYQEVAGDIRKATAASDGSINSLQSQRNAWTSLQGAVKAGSQEYKEAQREIERLDNKLNSRGNGLKRFGQTAGAIAASGVFGGPEGLIGSALGAFAGPEGALAGGAIGAQIGMFRQQLSGVADYTKELNLAKITLAQASTGQKDYNENLRIARQISADYTVDLKEAIQGYAQVSVAAKANGLSLKETEDIYRGVVAAGTAFGKSQEDITAIVTATVQVLSKGKISAEELQGQIGERLPGAVAKFAAATGRSLPQLAKDLQDGKVTIADFVKFSEKQVQNYDQIAKIIGSSPEKAGERLKLALDTASENYGGFFLKLSAMFADSMTKIVSWFNQNAETIQRLTYLYYKGFKAIADFVTTTYRIILGAGSFVKDAIANLIPSFGVILKMAEIAATLKGKEAFKNATDDYKKLFPEFKPLQGMYGNDNAAQQAAVDADADKKKAAEEKLAAERQQLAEKTMQAQIRLADVVFQHQVELDRKRYDLQQELINLQRQNYVDSLSGAKQDVASAVMQFKQQIDALERRSVEASQAVAQANQKLDSAQKMLSVTGSGIGGSTAGVYTQGGYGPGGANSYGPHFDIARVGGGYFSRNALDQFVTVNGRPLSSGTTVGGGQYGAMRDGGNRTHQAWDYAFGSGAQLSLGNGAQWKGSSRGSYGDNAVFMLPDGSVYRIIHGTFSAGITGKMPTGVVGQMGRATADQGDVNVANADVAAARASQKLTASAQSDYRKAYLLQFTNTLTKSIRDQTQSLEDNNAVQELRNRLQKEGMRPELIDIQAEALRLTQEQTQKVEELNAQQSKMAPDAYNAGLKAINDTYGELINKTREAAQAQLEFNDAMRYQQDARVGLGFQDGAKKYVESIGTMRDATSQLAQTGIKGVENALMDLATTGTMNFKAFAVSILNDTARIIIQQLVLRSVMQLIGFAGSGGGGGGGMGQILANQAPYLNANGNVFAANGIQPYAMGGIVNSPTLFKFAKGGAMQNGVMGEAGPEAIIPLKRGRDGKLGVAGGAGGGTSVTVNVDATGSSVQGDNGKSAELGRAMAQAVQNEIIRQKRPGGLLAA